jgi:hypothetical protein
LKSPCIIAGESDESWIETERPSDGIVRSGKR